MKKQMQDIRTHSVNVDTYGNPRIVIHFTSVFSDEESAMTREVTGGRYYLALVKAQGLGSFRRFHNKQFGGGIITQGSDWRDLPDFFADTERDCATARALILPIENDEGKNAQLLGDAKAFLQCWGFEPFAHNCVKMVKNSLKGRRKEEKPTPYQVELAGFHLASKYLARARS
jgi:hypothetical protein